MRFRSIQLIFIFLAGLSMTGCKKFLAKDSQDLVYADTYTKLDELLVGDAYEKHPSASFGIGFGSYEAEMYFPWLNTMDDDISEFVPGYDEDHFGADNRKDVFGFYTWQRNPFVSDTYVPSDDDMWKKIYTHISAVNTIADKATQLSDNPAALKRIRGEALFLRAGYYFQLVNIYAGAYNKATASTDLGVPLKVTDFVDDKFFSRSTIDSVYKQIVVDLNEAEQDLAGVSQPNLYHANVTAVNLLQSRVYLYMQDWTNAAAAADKVIAKKSVLYNLGAFQQKANFITTTSPEAIFTQGGNAMIYITFEDGTETFKASDELIGLYEAKDLRKSSFFELDQAGKYRYTKVYWSNTNYFYPTETFSDNFFLRASEAYLNKAEAAAMLGNPTDANQAINTLRQARFLPQDYAPVQYTDVALVNFIRDERRRELCFEGHRWFDLKRYAVNEKFPMSKTIVHTYSHVDEGSAPYVQATLQLLPHDAAYLIPIPDYAIIFNQGVLKPNPDRPNRQF